MQSGAAAGTSTGASSSICVADKFQQSTGASSSMSVADIFQRLRYAQCIRKKGEDRVLELKKKSAEIAEPEANNKCFDKLSSPQRCTKYQSSSDDAADAETVAEVTRIIRSAHRGTTPLCASASNCCNQDGCMVGANFGYASGPKWFCSKHKQEGMIDLKNKRCEQDGCMVTALFGHPGVVK